MAKAAKKKQKLTTNEALEALLGAKAAKRLRKLAAQIAEDDAPPKKDKKPHKSKKR